ncbi:NAD(P)/FAD-dependent oxidoreductase [Nonomuraea dietziae]|uniref:NAD(P)/FAD-dependent oxidoreductase n=1 Tax=Nonomuraea dietziae TaxID=65515 RepID=UPI0033E92239
MGASLAGLRAVEAARKSGFQGTITLIGAEPHLPYDRPPLSKALLEGHGPAAPPTFRTEAWLRGDLGVELVLGNPASALDTSSREVIVGDRGYGYDALVIATGASARPLPGMGNRHGVRTLRTVEDALAIRAALDRGARTVVIGAGFIGSEVASAARRRGLPVTIVEAMATPLVRAVGHTLGEACADLHTRNGTALRCGTTVAAIEGDGAVERVRLNDGTVLHTDLVVVGIGAAPATTWLDGSGVPVDDGVLCDRTLFTGVPGVYAAGDVARWHNPVYDRPMRLEHWTSAAEQGAAAAHNAVDPAAARAYSTVPYFWSDWYGSRIQFVGVPTADEIKIVTGELGTERWTALYREGNRLAGALTLDGQTEIMKYRSLIMRGTSWSDALRFAGRRRTMSSDAGGSGSVELQQPPR